METVRERLHQLINVLTDEQVENLLNYANQRFDYPTELPPDYDPANDPFLNGTLVVDLDPSLYRSAEDDRPAHESRS